MIRIAIVDDNAIIRAGLRQFFSEQADFSVVAEAVNGHEALAIVAKGEVDVLLLDLSMPDQSGVDALAEIKSLSPALPVLILSGFPEAHYANAMMRRGASAYLNKDCDPEDIVKAIRFLFRGRGMAVIGKPVGTGVRPAEGKPGSTRPGWPGRKW
jgi:hypothetical protein